MWPDVLELYASLNPIVMPMCVVRIWPDITVELSCWCFSECFMIYVSTDQFKGT